MLFRPANMKDILSIMGIVHDAQNALKSRHVDQWQNGYPNQNSIEEDIQKGIGYIICMEDEPVAYAAIVINGEPEYNNLEGQWLSNGDYLVIHRLCVKEGYTRMGLASSIMKSAIEMAKAGDIHSIKIDTHKDNQYMLSLLARNGFKYCGEIHYRHGERIAFEKVI